MGPKAQTQFNVQNLLRRAQPETARIVPDYEHRSITIELGGIGDDDPVWGEVSQALKRDGFFDSWKFVINGKEIKVDPKLTDELVKNQKQRTTSISETDVTDLKIGLANAQTVDDILKMMNNK